MTQSHAFPTMPQNIDISPVPDLAVHVPHHWAQVEAWMALRLAGQYDRVGTDLSLHALRVGRRLLMDGFPDPIVFAGYTTALLEYTDTPPSALVDLATQVLPPLPIESVQAWVMRQVDRVLPTTPLGIGRPYPRGFTWRLPAEQAVWIAVTCCSTPSEQTLSLPDRQNVAGKRWVLHPDWRVLVVKRADLDSTLCAAAEALALSPTASEAQALAEDYTTFVNILYLRLSAALTTPHHRASMAQALSMQV